MIPEKALSLLPFLICFQIITRIEILTARFFNLLVLDHVDPLLRHAAVPALEKKGESTTAR
jgi:hypothetical protein